MSIEDYETVEMCICSNEAARYAEECPQDFASNVQFSHIPEIISALSRVSAEFCCASTNGRDYWTDNDIKRVLAAIGTERLTEIIKDMYEESL